MIYWGHVMGTFVMRFLPVAWPTGSWAGPRRWCCTVFARGHLQRATDNMHQVLGPQRRSPRGAPADPRRVRQLRALHGRPGATCRISPRELSTVSGRGLGARRRGLRRTAQGSSSPPATSATGTWPARPSPPAVDPVSALVETLKPARWNERVQRTRIAAGVKAIPIEYGLRDMLAALRKREGLAVLVDRPLAQTACR